MARASLKHTIYWRLAQITLGLWVTVKYKTKVTWLAKPPKKGGFLLVANHANRNDPFLIGQHSRTPINYMANIDGVTGFNKIMSSGLGCFNIKKGRPDSKAFMEAMNILKKGYTVGIFVEGDRSWLGEVKEFSTATASLAKKMNKPVLMARVTGNYFARPRWSDIARNGRIFITYDLITAEEIQSMSKADIHTRIAKHIQNDDFTSDLLKDVTFSGKDLAVGVENILWKCPLCNVENEIKGEADTITCHACETNIAIDAKQNVEDGKGELKKRGITNLKEWFNWQLDHIKTAVADSNNTPLLSDTEVEIFEEPEENVWRSLGKGTFEMDRTGVHWKGDKSDTTLVWEYSDILNIVDNFNEFTLLNLKRNRYKIILNKTCCLKWSSYHEAVVGAN